MQGITGADFRVAGIPADWMILDVTPNPAANIYVGNILGNGGQIAFFDCLPPAGGCINLFTIRILPTSIRAGVRLDVLYHQTPTECWPCCPHVYGCNAPDYTMYCALGGEAWINGPPCTVGVAPRAWCDVKQLYR